MKYNCCTALWFILLNFPASQALLCQNLRERCRISEDECEGLLNTTERMCDLSGVNCQLKNIMNCNLTIFYFTEKYPEYKVCTCSDDIYCTIKKLLGKSCNTQHEHTVPDGPIKQEVSNIQKGFKHHPKITYATLPGKANDCILAKQLCKENHTCLSLYENFKSQCIPPQECILNDAMQSCWTAWSELRKTVMGNCVCLNSTKRKCIKVWNSIHNNTCLQHVKAKQISTHTGEKRDSKVFDPDTNYSQMTINLEWDTRSLKNTEYGGPKSCLDVATLCIGDSVCNRHLAVLMTACTVSGNVCNVMECQRTIRAFYETMPFNVSQMLAFCECPQSNEDCQKAGDVLHSKSCTVHTDVPMSCLDVVSSCLDNELCRERYRTYQSKCWKHAGGCHNSRNCLLGLNKEDLTCSGSDECHAAYIGTLGTKLQTPCTCYDGLDYEEQHLCDLFSHILHRKSCINRVTAKNIHASYSDAQEKQRIMTGSQTFQSDAVVYIIAYTSGIILISGIILLTLLQTRVCRSQQKSVVPRGNASESLMNS
ncbi:GDNF family receptor alpha-like isoform X2 [Mixophyes fleayi]|uniref:GDNF family receptor alpha-like isoform X2 n=1 Tax=Mixophyes fleayi TaxID=3061075 RepID=UPI003F4DD76A